MVGVGLNITGYSGFSYNGTKWSSEHNIVKIWWFLFKKEGKFVENHTIFTKWALVTANSTQI